MFASLRTLLAVGGVVLLRGIFRLRCIAGVPAPYSRFLVADVDHVSELGGWSDPGGFMRIILIEFQSNLRSGFVKLRRPSMYFLGCPLQRAIRVTGLFEDVR